MNFAIVKCVLSSDTLIVRPLGNGTSTEGAVGQFIAPPEKTLRLSGVQAPNKESGWQWHLGREHARKMLVGKKIGYIVENTLPSGTEFVQCFVPNSYLSSNNDNNKELANWALHLVDEGFVFARSSANSNQPLSTTSAELAEAQERAQQAQKGIHASSAPEVTSLSSEKLLIDDPRALIQQSQKKPLDGIVEQVRDGSTLRIHVPALGQTLTVQLSGIKAPACRVNVPNMEDLVEPFGSESRFFTESRLLQRDVRLILESNNNSGSSSTFLATVLHPAGNIAHHLVANGLARVVDWNIAVVTGGPQKLREAERHAK